VINFDEEIKKFKPSLEIDEAEEAIYAYESKDIVDILNDMMKDKGSKKN
jgi:hypothetical protein